MCSGYLSYDVIKCYGIWILHRICRTTLTNLFTDNINLVISQSVNIDNPLLLDTHLGCDTANMVIDSMSLITAVLTNKINELVNAFNNHTHTIQTGQIVCGSYPNAAPVQVPAVTSKAQLLQKSDYEDETVKH